MVSSSSGGCVSEWNINDLQIFFFEGPEDGSTPKLVARILWSFKHKIKELLCFRL